MKYTLEQLRDFEFWLTHELEATSNTSKIKNGLGHFSTGKRYPACINRGIDSRGLLMLKDDNNEHCFIYTFQIEGCEGPDDLSYFKIVPKTLEVKPTAREILAPPKSFHNFVCEVAREKQLPAYSNVLGTNVLLSVVAEEAAKRFEKYVKESYENSRNK